MASHKRTANKASKRSTNVLPENLPRALVRELGKLRDAVLAAKYGIPVERIRRERYLRGIKSRPGTGTLLWNAQQVAMLGTASDEEIARRLKVTKTAVFSQRIKRRIRPFGKSRAEQKHRWTAKQLSWLGNLTDAEIARRIGITQTSVAWKRRTMGIAPTKRGRSGHQWTKQQLSLLGKMPDIEVARKLGIHRHQVAMKREALGIENFVVAADAALWTTDVVKRLGTVPDSQIAAQLGISVGRVTMYRRRHKIKSYTSQRNRGNSKNRTRSDWSPDRIRRLGKVPDDALARELGITRQAVHQQRKRLGIAPYQSSQ